MPGGNSAAFVPSRDILSLEGKVILVTGANTGLGKEAVLEFARHAPAAIRLAVGDLDKGNRAAEDIRKQIPSAPIEVLQLDLSSLESVVKAAEIFSSASDRLDILMLNAGIVATPPGLTKNSYELQFGTNRMGHAHLATLLLPTMKRTAEAQPSKPPRIISLTSYGHRHAAESGIDFASVKTTGEELSVFGYYGQSKLAHILFVRQLAKTHPDLMVVAIHPGVAGTNLTDGSSPGARHQLWASVTEKGLKSGEYYEPLGMGGLAQPNGKDDELAKRPSDWTEDELQGYVSG
ncbi:hypothetical protein ACHAQH_007137 [Verticillium albo-atrum]